MKKILLALTLCVTAGHFAAQFKITVAVPAEFSSKEAYLYTLDGSKDILNTKQLRKGNIWSITVSKPYSGMLRMYFPDTNDSVSFISENKDVSLKLTAVNDKITDVEFLDEANRLMSEFQELQQKKQYILPALYQIKEYYKDRTDFGAALNKEIGKLSENPPSTEKFPFVDFYSTNYNKFVLKEAGKPSVTEKEIQYFLVNSGDMLETSSLMKPVLISYLNQPSVKKDISKSVDELLAAVNVETPRGQTVLSELIEIFDLYDMSDMRDKYLADAKNLKCTINDRLAATINTNVSTQIGAKFKDYTFTSATNTKAKSIYGVKADKKVIIFWASTCSHCEKEIPEILEIYNELKKKNVEVIGLSVDSEKDSYTNKIKNLPWINDAELKGWYSSYAETYNVHATPSYFILDADNKIIEKPENAKNVVEYFKFK
ncbi:MAG: TlpA disulfide reductase family protein [Bergeyella sp.]